MVRSYKRKPGSRKYRDYNNESLQRAIQLYRQGGNLMDLSEQYEIPYITLYRKVRGLHTKSVGAQPALSVEEENHLSNVIGIAADWGFPCDSDDIKDTVKTYLDRIGKQVPQFRDNRPGETWQQNFLLRHKDQLSKRLSQSIKESRAAVSPEVINKYFDHLTKSLEDVLPEAIVNYDETNFTDDPGRVKVVVRRSSKRAEKVMDTSKTATSVMFSCSASGFMLPVYIVYKADHLWNTWMENGPSGARYNRSRSGWFDGNIFEDWFSKIILPYFKDLPPGPKVLIGDNLASHLSSFVITECDKNNIRFILLPPNSTQLTQPLDVSVFRPIKAAWRKILQEWKKHNKGTIRKEVFPRLLKQALAKVSTTNEQNIRSGFEATGIWPLDRYKILNRLPKTDQQNLQEAREIVDSLKTVFEKSRFKTATSVGRKKKLLVEAGKSIRQEDLAVQIASGSGTKKKPKKKATRLPSSSSESNISEEQITADSDTDPETFSDLEEENNSTIIADSSVEMKGVSPGEYIYVDMKTQNGTKKQYAAKIINCEENDTYLCSFLRLSHKIKGVYTFPNVEDIGIVEKNEIKKRLLEYEVLRRGQIKFKDLI